MPFFQRLAADSLDFERKLSVSFFCAGAFSKQKNISDVSHNEIECPLRHQAIELSKERPL